MTRIKLILLLVAAFATTSCTRQVPAPPRPKGVPAEAIWGGGADGGGFIKCSYDAATGLNVCAVYNDYTGQLEAEGQFKITGRTRAEDVGRFAYSGFDGKRIYLKDGSLLVPYASAVSPGK